MLYPIELLGHDKRQHGSDHQAICHVCPVQNSQRSKRCISEASEINSVSRQRPLHLARALNNYLAIRMEKIFDRHISH